jgi:hypothetical protein
MRIVSAAILASTLLAAPAFAGDIEVFQIGRSNWIAANQYNSSNTAWVHQRGINEYGNNYASFAQSGRYNYVNSAQSSYTDNIFAATQYGRTNGVTAFQSAAGVNTFSVTQTRRR